MCETQNNEWKRYELSIQERIDNYIETTRIKPNFARDDVLYHDHILTKVVMMWLGKRFSTEIFKLFHSLGNDMRRKMCI